MRIVVPMSSLRKIGLGAKKEKIERRHRDPCAARRGAQAGFDDR